MPSKINKKRKRKRKTKHENYLANKASKNNITTTASKQTTFQTNYKLKTTAPAPAITTTKTGANCVQKIRTLK